MARDFDLKYSDSDMKEKRKWDMLDTAQSFLPYGESVQKCNRVTLGSVKVERSLSGNHRLSGLVTCKSKWSCPVCTPRLAAERANQVSVMNTLIDLESVMVTYTVQHSVNDKLESLMHDLYSSIRSIRSGRYLSKFREDARGYVRSTEIVHGRNGWHPHVHELIYLNKGGSITSLEDSLVKNYKAQLQKRGKKVNRYTVTVKSWDGDSSYITKGSETDEVTGWVNKNSYASKNIFSILSSDMPTAIKRRLYNEYFYATKRRKLTIVSRSLIPVMDRAKEIIAEESLNNEWMPVQTILADQWSSICRSKARWHILVSASCI